MMCGHAERTSWVGELSGGTEKSSRAAELLLSNCFCWADSATSAELPLPSCAVELYGTPRLVLYAASWKITSTSGAGKPRRHPFRQVYKTKLMKVR
jgi:hypothetical protein